MVRFIDVHSGGPSPGPPWPGHLRAVPGPALSLSGPCRVSPRAGVTAQARAHVPFSCRASPRSPAYLSGSGRPRPTMGASRRRRRRACSSERRTCHHAPPACAIAGSTAGEVQSEPATMRRRRGGWIRCVAAGSAAGRSMRRRRR